MTPPDEKYCKKCSTSKSLTSFHKNRSECKDCARAYKERNKENIKSQKQQYYIKNKEHILVKCSNYTTNNAEKVKQTKKAYREANREAIREYHRKLYNSNADEMNAESKRRYRLNREKKLAQNKAWKKENVEAANRMSAEWVKNNRARHLENQRKWRDKNRERLGVSRRARLKERRRTDENYKIACKLRGSLYAALCGASKSKSALVLLGCTIPEFKIKLQDRFEPSMNWENWGNGIGKWNLDHIRPISSFDLTDPSQQHLCFHYSNMQPLWWKDNMEKSNKLDWEKPKPHSHVESRS